MYHSLDASAVVATSVLGVSRFPLAVPNDPALVNGIVYAQFFPLDPTGNARGITASNYGRILIGL